jgi:hypothetical protein
MARTGQRRLLEERAMEQGIAAARGDGIRARSVTVNIAESPLGWPARAGKLVLTLALDRVADFYRVR